MRKKFHVLLLVLSLLFLSCGIQLYFMFLDVELLGYSEPLLEIGAMGSAASLIFILLTTQKESRASVAKWTLRINVLTFVCIAVFFLVAMIQILTDAPARI